ncbi:MAG: DUF1559 domain-containing protein [Planctomycetaceae bacterium]|nr:DUF1559 domain-containing protein [Planctomycetaceae bacterium]
MLRKLFQIRVVPVFFVSAILFITTINLTVAQETFAPLITDNCIGFIHVDLRKLDLNKTKSGVVKLGENYLKDLNFDEKSFNATMREFNKEIDKIEQLIRPHFEQVTEKLGLRELAVIFYDIMEMKLPALPEENKNNVNRSYSNSVIAIPWKNKSNEDLELLLSLLDSVGVNIDYVLTPEFILLNPQRKSQPTHLQENFIPLSEIVPSKNAPIYEVLKEAGDDEIKIAFVITDKLRKNFIQIKPDQNMPEQLKILTAFWAFSINKIDWVSASVSLGRLISDSKKESFRLTIKTPNENDAVFLRNLLENSIDNDLFFVQYAPDAPQIAYEFLRGLFRSVLPVVKGNRLVSSFESADMSKINNNAFVTYCGFGAALLLPAIQAAHNARQKFKSREGQNIENIRNIMLAFHNYCGANLKLPPLYTVDAEGKPLHSWRVLLLPYLGTGYTHLYEKIRLNEPWDSEYNKQFHNVFIKEYVCPQIMSYNGNEMCNYAVIAGQPLTPQKSSDLLKDIIDGTSNTVSIVVVKKPFYWMDPKADITLEDFLKGVNKKDSVVGVDASPSGVNVGFWDGSTRFIPNDIPIPILKIIGTANGRESYGDTDKYLKVVQ